MKKLAVMVAALAMLASSAYAADWEFYGSARVATFYNDVETINTPTTANAKNIQENLVANSRIGANVKVSDELAGRFEYGASGGNANIRLLYGEWNFGAGKLLVGQDYTLVRFPHSNQVYNVDNGLGGEGELGSSRTAQLKLTFGGLQLAAVAPSAEFWNADPARTTPALNSVAARNAVGVLIPAISANPAGTEVKLPGLQAKYIFTGENWTVSALGAYQTFEVDPNAIAADVKSYVLGVGGSITFGAVRLAAQVHGGENVGNMSTVQVGGTQGAGYAKWDGTKIIDNEAFGYSLVFGYTVNDMLGVEVGYGKMQTEYDEAASIDNEVQTYYLSLPITLAPGVTVTPEVGVVDQEETSQTETTYFGAKWQINF